MSLNAWVRAVPQRYDMDATCCLPIMPPPRPAPLSVQQIDTAAALQAQLLVSSGSYASFGATLSSVLAAYKVTDWMQLG
eukprot:scaffold585945_cov47-Prasinocladus_malaysianus.AAC.1